MSRSEGRVPQLRAYTPKTIVSIRDLPDDGQKFDNVGLPWTTWNSATVYIVWRR